MQHHVDIPRTPEQVFAYVSSPTRWHEWHPYHVAINAPDGSLPAGSRFGYVGGRAGTLSWEVVEVIPGQRWLAKATGRFGLHMQVTYTCEGDNQHTRFTRTLEYRFDSWIGRIANHLFARKGIEKDSVALLQKLATVAELAIPSA